MNAPASFLKRSEAINDLATALAAAQGKIQGAHKDKANPYYGSNYADLASVWDACREPLSSNGLAVMQFPDAEIIDYEGVDDKTGKEVPLSYAKVRVTTLLVHSSGQWCESEIMAESRDAGPQAIGSVITFLRRYLLQALVGVAPEDDDGNEASTPPAAAQRTYQQQPRQTAASKSNGAAKSPQFEEFRDWLLAQVPSRFPSISEAWKPAHKSAERFNFNASTLMACTNPQVFDGIRGDLEAVKTSDDFGGPPSPF